jgi:hypothetical protein
MRGKWQQMHSKWAGNGREMGWDWAGNGLEMGWKWAGNGLGMGWEWKRVWNGLETGTYRKVAVGKPNRLEV